MSEHLSAEQIDRYRQRALTPAELLAVDDHLAGCDACRRHLIAAGDAVAAVTSLQAELQTARSGSNHLPYEQLVAYIDSQLNDVDREIVEGHLDTCPACLAETRDLRSFRTLLTTYPEREYAPATPLALQQRLLALWRGPASWAFLPAMGAAAALLLVGIGTHLLRTERAHLQTQVARLQQQNAALRQEMARAEELRTRLARLEGENEKFRQDTRAARGTIDTLKTRLASREAAAEPVTPSAGIGSKPIEPIRPPSVGSTPHTLLALNDGGRRVTLDAGGSLEGLASLSSELRDRVKATLASARVDLPAAVADLVGRQGRLMGPGEEGVPFALLRPVGTVTRTDRPIFVWQPLPNAQSYRVAVYDEAFTEVARSETLSQTKWQVPQPLAPGKTYLWQVTALRDGDEVTSPAPPAPEARFRVLGPAAAAALARAERRYAASPLTLGVLYAREGLLDDAERAFSALAAANPRSSVARRLLESLRDRRRPSS